MKFIRFLAIVLCVMLLSACGGGDVRQVERQIGEPLLFSKQDVADAMDRVEKHFKAKFNGCKLLTLYYDEEKTGEEAAEWAVQYGEEEAIVLLSDFEVDASGGDGSLNPGETYRNWKWVLTRSGEGQWELRTWGYG